MENLKNANNGHSILDDWLNRVRKGCKKIKRKKQKHTRTASYSAWSIRKIHWHTWNKMNVKWLIFPSVWRYYKFFLKYYYSSESRRWGAPRTQELWCRRKARVNKDNQCNKLALNIKSEWVDNPPHKHMHAHANTHTNTTKIIDMHRSAITL